MNRLLPVALAALFALAPCATAQTLFAFGTVVAGENEVPSVTSDGLGYVSLVYIDNPGATPDSFVVAGNFDDLEGTYNASHLHKAPAGSNGGIVQGLTATTDPDNQGGAWDASLNRYAAPAGFLADLQAGTIYANVHSAFSPSGELRGQLSAAPLLDGDLSDTQYLSLATKQNANTGFGPDIDATEIVYFADKDAEVLYLGVKGKLNQFSSDGIGLWLNFDDPVGASAGTELGKVPGAAFNYFDSDSSRFTADFEVDYAFSINPGGTSTSAFFDAATYVDSTRSDFLGTADQSGTAVFGPADSTSNTGGPVFFTSLGFAFDNSGSGDTGLEFAIPFADLGIDAANAGNIQAFAFVVSSTGYFSDVTVPGDVTSDNPGFNPDFNANMTSAFCACSNASSTIGVAPYNATALLCPPTGPNFDLTASVSSMTVPAGGSFTVNFSVANNTANNATGDLFYTASRNGNTLAQANIFNDQTVNANSTRSGSYVQNVPGIAPPGTYTYTVRIGNFPNATVDSEVFMITVVAPGRSVVNATHEWSVSDAVWGIEEGVEAASRATASAGAYPNPFARETTIRFETAEVSKVRLAVYDVTGREVAVLVDRTVEAGTHEATFDARGLASGLYVWHLEAGNRAETGRVTLVR